MKTPPEIASELQSNVVEWRPRLLNVPLSVAHARPSTDRWSISEVVGHLVDSACNNHQRFVRAQTVQDLVFPKYDQNHWMNSAGYREADWQGIVELWYQYNRLLAGLICRIPSDQFATPCTITPYETCDLRFLVEDYLDHMNHHLSILERRITAID